MDELLDQFLIEGRELVQQATDDLLALERDQADGGRIDSAFRAVHTLKGSAGLFDFAPMGDALHAAEDLLSVIRAGSRTADRPAVDALLDCIGLSADWIEAIAQNGRLPEDATHEGRRLGARLQALIRGGDAPPDPAPQADDLSWLTPLAARHASSIGAARSAGQTVTALRYCPSEDCFFLGDDPLRLLRAVPNLIGLDVSTRAPIAPDAFDPHRCQLVFEALTTADRPALHAIFRLVVDQVVLCDVASGPSDPGAAPQTPDSQPRHGDGRVLRVDPARIEHLADLVGEMIVAKNALAHLAREATATESPLATALHENETRIARLVGEMHGVVMQIRLVPLMQTFRRFPRLVREAAAGLGKSVDLRIEGESVEADKSIADALFEPLLHILRNAIDHGIEDPTTRAAAAKPAVGQITLEARQAGDQIAIAVTDDGAGIDPARLRQTAKMRGLMESAAIDALSDEEAMSLIFEPGFTTATSVTGLSGRGVGMDAVRARVHALGGRVGLTSTPGRGSRFELTLPQAAAVTTVMIVRVGSERFGIPIDAIVETRRIPAEAIIAIQSGGAFVLRNRTIPLLKLGALLNVASLPRARSAKIVVASVAGERVGLEVDALAERLDILLRPLSGLLAGMRGLLGTTLLGDGRVLVILDLPELLS